jgi:hypothetical protein
VRFRRSPLPVTGGGLVAGAWLLGTWLLVKAGFFMQSPIPIAVAWHCSNEVYRHMYDAMPGSWTHHGYSSAMPGVAPNIVRSAAAAKSLRMAESFRRHLLDSCQTPVQLIIGNTLGERMVRRRRGEARA